MIIQCEACSKKLKVPDSSAGKKAKCPGCGEVIYIGSPGTSSDSPPKKRRAAESRSAEKRSADRPAARKRRPQSGAGEGGGPRRRPASSQQGAPRRRKRRPARQRPVESDPYKEDLFDDLPYGDDYGDDDYEEVDNPYAAPKATGRAKKRSSGKRSSEGLRTVGKGLILQGSCVVAMIVLFVLLLFAVAATRGTPVVLTVVNGFRILLYIVTAAIVVSEFMCLAAPAESGTKALIYGAVAGTVLSTANQIYTQFLGPPPFVLQILASLAVLARAILFPLFLRSIASYAGYHNHAKSALTIIIGLPASAVLIFAVALAMPGLKGAGAIFGMMAVLLLLAACVAMLVFAIMYVFLLFRLGRDLRR